MELQIFQNAEFGSVRSTMLKEEPYFVGKDVAEILGYADPNKAIAMHVDEDDKLNDKTASSLGQRGGWFINESGLYSLILSSKLPAAKRFKRWVTSEVLPAIRRHGLYAVDDMLNNPDALIEALQAYKAVPTLNLEGNISAEEEDIDYSDDENTDAVDTSDVPEVTLGCKVVIRNIDKETKTYKYDMVNGMLPKAVEVFTGCKVGDVIEMRGKEWRIEDVIF